MDSWKERYISALCEEIKRYPKTDIVDTIYFGGGTPTVLKPESLGKILDVIKEKFCITKDCEITFECNPATIDEKGFKELKDYGFNRVSIGLQSADNDMLKFIGRIHSFEDFERCFKDARNGGFDNISLDLIFGLPNQTEEDWKNTLEKAVKFNPEHISCYALKVEDGTPFAKMDLQLPDDDLSRKLYDMTIKYLEEKGYNQYEISNFARNGLNSRHNCRYWQCMDYAGFGAGAYSCVENKRYSNILKVPEYCEFIEENKSVILDIDKLSTEDKISEFCFLGLRMTAGISKSEFKDRFGREIESVYGDVIEKNIKRGTLVLEDNRIYIPKEWLYVSNGILVDFV